MQPISNFIKKFFSRMKTAYRSFSFSKKFAILIQALGIFVPLVSIAFTKGQSIKIGDFAGGVLLIGCITNPVNILIERIQKKYRITDILKKIKYVYLVWFAICISIFSYMIINYKPEPSDDGQGLFAMAIVSMELFATILFSSIAFCIAKPASFKRELFVLAISITTSAYLYL